MSGQGTLSTLARLLPPLRAEWPRIVTGYLVATMSMLTLVALGVLAALGVGRAVIDGTLPSSVWWFAMVALVLLRVVLTWHEMDASHALAYRVLARLRMALFDAYARSVPGRWREHSGRAAGVVMTDLERLEFFYAHTIAQMGAAVTVFLVAVLGALAVMPGAALVVLIGGIAVATSVWWSAATAHEIGHAEQRERESHSERIVDALGAVREVLAYGLEQRIIEQVRESTRRSGRTSRRRAVLSAGVDGLRELLLSVVVVAIIAQGIVFPVADDLLAWLPALLALAVSGVASVAEAARIGSALHPLAAAAQRVGDALERPATVTAATRPLALPSGALGVRFREVTFAYGDGSTALDRWSAVIEPGEHVGITGPSGAGKSTAIALAARLWDPASGTVSLIDDSGREYPVSALSDSDLRRVVAVVEQEPRLFHGTVREELQRGTEALSDEELHRALVRVGADTWITLDDRLGEHGMRLSGGQQARLALARALCRAPRILLLDEITASLDPVTERVISDVVAQFEGTVLLASHRRETLERVSRVIPVVTTAPVTAGSPRSR